MGLPWARLVRVRLGEAQVGDRHAVTEAGVDHGIPVRPQREVAARARQRVDPVEHRVVHHERTGDTGGGGDAGLAVHDPRPGRAAVALDAHRRPISWCDRDAHRRRTPVAHDQRGEQRDAGELRIGVPGETGSGQHQLEVTRAGEQRVPAGDAVLVDDPVVTAVEPPDEVHGAVAGPRTLAEHGVLDRLPLVDREMGPATGIGGDPDVRPQTEVDRGDAELAVLTGEGVEHGVGGDVAGLAVGLEQGAGRRHQDERSGAAPLELVDERERGARLGLDHEAVIGRFGHLDQPVAQAPGGVDRAVDRPDAAFGLVERTPHRGRIGDIGDDDRDLRAARLQLAQLADPARGRVVVRMGGEPAVTHRGFRHVVGGEQHEVGFVLGREVRCEDVSDAAERARDEIRATAAERRAVRHGGDRLAFDDRREAHAGAHRHDLRPVAEHVVDDVGDARSGLVDVDQSRREPGILAWRDCHDASARGRRRRVSPTHRR